MAVDTAARTFPIEWKNPEDAQLTWFRDEMHFPEPLTPLTVTLLLDTFDEGNPLACDELAMPMTGLLYGSFNGYAYNVTRPVPEGEMPARMERNKQVMPERMDNLRRLWDEQYRARVIELTDTIDSLDLEHAAVPEVGARLGQLRDVLVELWHIHFLVVFPKLGCGERFFGIYNAATGSDDQTAAYRCLQGFANKSVEAGKALWELSRLVMENESVRAAVIRGDLTTLEGTPFEDALDRYLDEYGRRANGIELALPLWLEKPEFVLGLVRSYLVGEKGDPDVEHAALVEERERLIAEALDQVAGTELEAAFRGALQAAQAAWPLEEDHAFYIDQRALAAVRLQLLGLGRRLAGEGKLAEAEDVWFAKYDEVAAAATGDAELTDLTRARRREHEAQRTLEAPPFLGAPPTGAADPGLEKFFGKAGPPELEGTVLRGSPASAGRVTGTARVIARIDELDRVRPGDILVCRSTTPPWTPVFGSIAALVTDTGGVLSHGAIVAREYRLPAVVGTKIGTRVILDGQTITVDGERGEVLLAAS
jgi:phosphohistidine swiveling domain-containing protein